MNKSTHTANSSLEAIRPTQYFRNSHAEVAAYFTRGARQNVLLLHGNSSCKEVFGLLFDQLAEEGHSVLAPDLPGHGDSENAADPQRTYTFPGYSDAITELLDAVCWRDFIVIGWSLGGHIAMELADRRQQDCKGLMIVGSPPGKPSEEVLVQAFYTTETTLLAGKREFSDADAAAYVGAMLGKPKPEPFFLSRALRTDGRAREIMFTSAMAGVGVDQSLVAASSVRPLAVVQGRLEPFVRLEYLEGLTYGNLWQNKVLVIENAGHAPHVEQPDVFAGIVQSFVEFIEA